MKALRDRPRLVADIGGTHARCSLVIPDESHPGLWCLSATRVVECTDHDGLEEVLDEYLAGQGGERPVQGCLAVAGPVTGDRVRLTNLDWEFSVGDLRRRLRFEHLDVINDCAAVACATGILAADQMVELVAGEALPAATRVSIGCGTGLGVGALAYDGQRWLPVQSEGGHATAAAGSEFELDVLRAARSFVGHVSAESLLSGPGLQTILRSLAKIEGSAAPAYTPEEITSIGVAGGDPLCVNTVGVFASMLGGFVGNIALTYGATGGVYLAGDLLRCVQPVLEGPNFAKAFHDKGAMRAYLADIPVQLVVAEFPGLIGAAAWLATTLEKGAVPA